MMTGHYQRRQADAARSTVEQMKFQFFTENWNFVNFNNLFPALFCRTIAIVDLEVLATLATINSFVQCSVSYILYVLMAWHYYFYELSCFQQCRSCHV